MFMQELDSKTSTFGHARCFALRNHIVPCVVFRSTNGNILLYLLNLKLLKEAPQDFLLGKHEFHLDNNLDYGYTQLIHLWYLVLRKLLVKSLSRCLEVSKCHIC